MLTVTVKTLDSQNHTFQVGDNILVKEFKDVIKDQMQIPSELQKLIYCGRVLQDDKRLADYDINEKVVHLVRKQSAQDTNQPPDPNQGTPQNIRDLPATHPAWITGGSIEDFMPRLREVFMNSLQSARGRDDPPVSIQINLGPTPSERMSAQADGRLRSIRRILGYVNNTLNELDRIPNNSTPIGTSFSINASSLNNQGANPTNASPSTEEVDADGVPTFIHAGNVQSAASSLVSSVISSTMNALFGIPMGARVSDLTLQSPNEASGTFALDANASQSTSSRPTTASNVPTNTGERENSSSTQRSFEPFTASQSGRGRFEILSDLYEQTMRTQQRVDVHLRRMIDGMRNYSSLSEASMTSLQEDHRMISRVTHHMGHIYHLLSDLRVHFASEDQQIVTMFQLDQPARLGRAASIRTMSESRRPRFNNSNDQPSADPSADPSAASTAAAAAASAASVAASVAATAAVSVASAAASTISSIASTIEAANNANQSTTFGSTPTTTTTANNPTATSANNLFQNLVDGIPQNQPVLQINQGIPVSMILSVAHPQISINPSTTGASTNAAGSQPFSFSGVPLFAATTVNTNQSTATTSTSTTQSQTTAANSSSTSNASSSGSAGNSESNASGQTNASRLFRPLVGFERPSFSSAGFVLDPHLRCSSPWVNPEVRGVYDVGVQTSRSRRQPTVSTSPTQSRSTASARSPSNESNEMIAEPIAQASFSRNHLLRFYLIVSRALTEDEIVEAFSQTDLNSFVRVLGPLRDYINREIFYHTPNGPNPPAGPMRIQYEANEFVQPYRESVTELFTTLSISNAIDGFFQAFRIFIEDLFSIILIENVSLRSIVPSLEMSTFRFLSFCRNLRLDYPNQRELLVNTLNSLMSSVYESNPRLPSLVRRLFPAFFSRGVAAAGLSFDPVTYPSIIFSSNNRNNPTPSGSGSNSDSSNNIKRKLRSSKHLDPK